MKILIVGTAGRDFHVFNTLYRDDPDATVVAFTAAEPVTGGTGRYPHCLTGPRYPDGIPILPEAGLEAAIRDHGVEQVVFAYSEIGCGDVAGLAARVLAAGADFQLVNPQRCMLASPRPMVAVTSARSGAGKSPTVRYLAELLRSWGLRVAVVRHPLRVQGFTAGHEHTLARIDDVVVDACAAPSREPFDGVPGVHVYTGLDFRAVGEAAGADADVVVWDGAGNDLPFLRPSLHIVVTDPLRGDETGDFFPGEVGLRMADVVLVSKCDAATPEQVAAAARTVGRLNPDAALLTADSPVVVADAHNAAGRTVVVVEEALTLSLGALRPGAGTEAARLVGATAILSPLPQAVGRLAEVYARHPEAQSVLPAMGYGPDDLRDLRETLEATPSEAVIDATRIDLARVLDLTRPVARAGYAIRPHDPDRLAALVRAAVLPPQ